MAVTRFIYVNVDPGEMAEAEQIWKTECAPLMIKQPGCLSEQLLKCLDAEGEYISSSEWESQEHLAKYLASPDHQQLKQHAGNLKRPKPPIVKRYQAV